MKGIRALGQLNQSIWTVNKESVLLLADCYGSINCWAFVSPLTSSRKSHTRNEVEEGEIERERAKL